MFALLVVEVGTDQVDLDEGAEHAGGLPLEVIGRHHCNTETTMHSPSSITYTSLYTQPINLLLVCTQMLLVCCHGNGTSD